MSEELTKALATIPEITGLSIPVGMKFPVFTATDFNVNKQWSSIIRSAVKETNKANKDVLPKHVRAMVGAIGGSVIPYLKAAKQTERNLTIEQYGMEQVKDAPIYAKSGELTGWASQWKKKRVTNSAELDKLAYKRAEIKAAEKFAAKFGKPVEEILKIMREEEKKPVTIEAETK